MKRTPLRRRTPLRSRAALTRRSRLRTRRKPSDPDLRRQVFERDGWRCRVCGEWASMVHHRRLKSQGGTDELENLMSVDAVCHDLIHGNVAESVARGWIIQVKP